MSAANGILDASLIKDFRNAHRGAVIDENGREIPITTQMVEQACDKLERLSSAKLKKTSAH